ncbi:MAG TPA: fatty acid desaturase [Kofleriaceae bacterium]|nr:fatty acid desaturase [Kofleriaceae bacterium]
MLRYRADRRTVVYMVLATGLLVVQWNLDELSWPLYALAAFTAVAVTVIAHNHNHLGMWKSRKLNALTDCWLTLFYGFPAFAWIPTHNMNHHKFTNREGDYTLTYRYSERNNLLTLVSYPTISGYHQQKPIRDYLRELWRKNRGRFWASVSQYALLAAFIGGALLLDWRKALLYVVVPQQIGLFVVLVFNYLQHVHADEESVWNHSRNFTSPLLNFLLLNNGYHTVHHEKPGTHWSRLAVEHARIANQIDPVLNVRSFWWYLARTYLLAPFVPAWRSRSLRQQRLAARGTYAQ